MKLPEFKPFHLNKPLLKSPQVFQNTQDGDASNIKVNYEDYLNYFRETKATDEPVVEPPDAKIDNTPNNLENEDALNNLKKTNEISQEKLSRRSRVNNLLKQQQQISTLSDVELVLNNQDSDIKMKVKRYSQYVSNLGNEFSDRIPNKKEYLLSNEEIKSSEARSKSLNKLFKS